MASIPWNYLLGASAAAAWAFLAFRYLQQQNKEISFPREEVKRFAQQVRGKRADDDFPLLGLVVLVTGSTSGLGKEAAQIASELYLLGAHVIIASRNKAKCEMVVQEIRELHPSANGKGDLEIGVVDTADLDSVDRFAKNFLKTHNKLHYLVNNAGIQYIGDREALANLGRFNQDHVSKQGYDLAFATNYLGHFLLTRELQDLIIRSASDLAKSEGNSSPKFIGRVINVASSYHFGSSGNMLRPTEEKHPTPLAARSDMQSFMHKYTSYGNNKLAQVLHAKELQRRLPAATNVVALSICPGWTKTPMLPKNKIGEFIYAYAFPANAAVLAPIKALLDPTLQGGEFVTNYVNPIVWIPGASLLLRLLTIIHPHLRSFFTDSLAMLLLLTQNISYGYHVGLSSDVSMDKNLASALYEWTDKELSDKGYGKGSSQSDSFGDH